MSSGPIILITGSNQGLGLEVAKALCQRSTPYHIILTSRTVSKAEDAAKYLKTTYPSTSCTFFAAELDSTSPQSVAELAKTVASHVDHIDVLINNAGQNNDRKMPPKDDGSLEALQKRFEIYNNTFATNVSGADIVLVGLLSLLLKSTKPRLTFTSSGLASLGWASDSSHFYSGPIDQYYRSTKSALNMLGLMWSKYLTEKGVEVYLLDPGWNATNFGGQSPEFWKSKGAQDPEIGGGFIADVVEGKWVEHVGKFICQTGEAPW